MDLKEYIRVLQEEKKLFLTATGGLWLLAFLWFLLQPVTYNGILLLNIGRNAGEPTTEYSYDSFYRLQADERFADTLVRWLANPRIVSDILAASGTSAEHYTEQGLQGMFQAKRLSSQVVEVRFQASTREAIDRYADALISTSQEYTETLNASQSNWFRVSGSEPVVRDGRVPAFPFLALSFLVSVFIAFWSVFLKHYFKTPGSITK